jgi:hypothetical protein
VVLRVNSPGGSGNASDEILFELQQAWAEVSHQIQRLRDNVETADQEFALIADQNHKGLIAQPTYDLNEPVEAPFINTRRPNMAILREQGVNGHVEMAAAFDKVGFNTIDVHMSDLLAGRVSLSDFEGLVACGGFSYGDVMGAGGDTGEMEVEMKKRIIADSFYVKNWSIILDAVIILKTILLVIKGDQKAI